MYIKLLKIWNIKGRSPIWLSLKYFDILLKVFVGFQELLIYTLKEALEPISGPNKVVAIT